jgi:hypothetical protein
LDKLILQFRHSGSATPSVDEVARIFGIKPEDLDSDYGVIATDPSARLYTVLVNTSTEPKIKAALAQRPKYPDEGLFGNPRVEGFDLPKK